MKKQVVFVYPCSKPGDAVAEWVRMLSRHATRHLVRLVRDRFDFTWADAAFVLTSAQHYTPERIDAEIQGLRAAQVPFAVIHHNDHGQPTPGDYPSVVWTEAGLQRLPDYRPEFVRMPVMPAGKFPAPKDLLVGTFGHIEPKKRTVEMARRMQDLGIPFVAFGPDVFSHQYADYIQSVREAGARVELHRWRPRLEDCTWLARCSHFLFFLPPSRANTGGGSMTPRQIAHFGRPVLVVDDEAWHEQDGFLRFDSLEAITREAVERAKPVLHHFGPDEYLDELCRVALRRPC